MSSHSSTKYRSTESDSHGSTRPSDNSERRPKRAPADDSTTQMRQRGVDPVTIANPHSNEIVNYDKGDMRTPAPISSDSTSTFTRDAGDGRGAAPIRSRDVRYQDDRDRGAIRSTTTDRDKPLPHSKDQERVPASRSHTDRANNVRESGSSIRSSQREHSPAKRDKDRIRTEDRERPPVSYSAQDAHRRSAPRSGVVDLGGAQSGYESIMSRPMDNPDTRKADEMVVDMLESIEVREERHLLVSKEKKEPGLQAVLEDTRTRSEDSDSSMEYELVELEDSRITQKQEQEAKDHALAQEIQEAERAESDTSSSDSDETALPQKKSWTAMVIGGSSGTSDKYKARAKHYKLRYIEVSHELERKRKEASSFTQQWSTLLMENQSHAQYIRRIEEENRGLKFELQNVKQQLSDAVNLSEVRGKELKGAQVFLTKADSLSTSDVVQKVLDLNDEIFQAAALLGETLAYQVYEDGVDRVEARQSLIQGSMERARWMLGPRLAEILAKESLKPPKEATNPLLVQIVMQSALTQWCYSVAHRWCTGTEHDNEVIQNLYEDIRATEEQAVAGRWRSLTRAHLQTSATGWVQNVRDGIIPVMQVAGWTCADLFQFEKRLPSIFKALQDIRKATGEDVTSTDLEVITVVDGKGFDPNFMEDAYGDGRGDSSALKAVGKSGDGDDPPAHLVVASVGLGLRQVILKRHSNGAVSKRATWIASPKVVLEKTIKEAIEPPPPTTRRRKRNGGEGVVGAAMSAVANLVSGSGPSPSNNA